MRHTIIIAALLIMILLGGCSRPPFESNKGTTTFDLIQGCWGVHPETGNSVLCITAPDSLFWVDPSLWCKYSIKNDTITMLLDTFVYFEGRIEYRDDSLILSNSDFTWVYERYQEK